MLKKALCPVTDQRIGRLTVRIHALIVVLTLMVFFITLHIIPALLLLSDFLVRVLNLPKLSPIGIASRFIASQIPIKNTWENAGPKLFAARIGLMFSAAICISLLTGNLTAAIIAAGILAFFSFLEGAFGFCVACVIYPYLTKGE